MGLAQDFAPFVLFTLLRYDLRLTIPFSGTCIVTEQTPDQLSASIGRLTLVNQAIENRVRDICWIIADPNRESRPVPFARDVRTLFDSAPAFLGMLVETFVGAEGSAGAKHLPKLMLRNKFAN